MWASESRVSVDLDGCRVSSLLGTCAAPNLLPWHRTPPLKMEARTLPETTRLRRPESGRQKSHGTAAEVTVVGLTSSPCRVDAGGPRTRAMSHPELQADVTTGLAGLAWLQELFAEDEDRRPRFCEGVPFSAPPLRPQENNRVFNLSWS